MNLIFTREQTIEEHRKMWNWIADEIERQEICITKADYIVNFYPEFLINGLLNYCFCCQYTRMNCLECPLKWGEEETDSCLRIFNGEDSFDSGLYSEWCDANAETDYKKTAELARKIANLPEK